MIHFKLLEKWEQTKPKSNRHRKIIKIRADINAIKTKKLYKDSMKQKVGSFTRLTRSANSYPTWQNGGGKGPKLIKSMMKKGGHSPILTKIQRIIKEFF
jgi:hypothetical protein